MTAPLDASQIDWRMPASANLRDFPLEGGPIEGGFIVCSNEQLAWLDANAIQDDGYSPFVDITVHNTADSGTAMSLENLRFDGTEVFDEATVMFQCPDLGRGDGIRQVIMLETSGNAAVWEGGELWCGTKPNARGRTGHHQPGSRRGYTTNLRPRSKC